MPNTPTDVIEQWWEHRDEYFSVSQVWTLIPWLSTLHYSIINCFGFKETEEEPLTQKTLIFFPVVSSVLPFLCYLLQLEPAHLHYQEKGH